MLYEIKFDNTKNVKLNESIFNCSIKKETLVENILLVVDYIVAFVVVY